MRWVNPTIKISSYLVIIRVVCPNPVRASPTEFSHGLANLLTSVRCSNFTQAFEARACPFYASLHDFHASSDYRNVLLPNNWMWLATIRTDLVKSQRAGVINSDNNGFVFRPVWTASVHEKQLPVIELTAQLIACTGAGFYFIYFLRCWGTELRKWQLTLGSWS